jgi:hypothetical protein
LTDIIDNLQQTLTSVRVRTGRYDCREQRDFPIWWRSPGVRNHLDYRSYTDSRQQVRNLEIKPERIESTIELRRFADHSDTSELCHSRRSLCRWDADPSQRFIILQRNPTARAASLVGRSPLPLKQITASMSRPHSSQGRFIGRSGRLQVEKSRLQSGKGVALPASLCYPAAMAINEPSNVTPINQAERRRAKAQRQSLIRRVLPYLVILTIAGIGGVASLRSMPVGSSVPAANAPHQP